MSNRFKGWHSDARPLQRNRKGLHRSYSNSQSSKTPWTGAHCKQVNSSKRNSSLLHKLVQVGKQSIRMRGSRVAITRRQYFLSPTNSNTPCHGCRFETNYQRLRIHEERLTAKCAESDCQSCICSMEKLSNYRAPKINQDWF